MSDCSAALAHVDRRGSPGAAGPHGGFGARTSVRNTFVTGISARSSASVIATPLTSAAGRAIAPLQAASATASAGTRRRRGSARADTANDCTDGPDRAAGSRGLVLGGRLLLGNDGTLGGPGTARKDHAAARRHGDLLAVRIAQLARGDGEGPSPVGDRR